MFVLLSVIVTGESSPTRIAAQVVSGIGFLGGESLFETALIEKVVNGLRLEAGVTATGWKSLSGQEVD